MQRPLTDELYIVEGAVSDVISRQGVAQFRIDDQWFRLVTSCASAVIEQGDSVRMLVQDSGKRRVPRQKASRLR